MTELVSLGAQQTPALNLTAGEFGMQGRRREFEDCSSVLLAEDFAQSAGNPIPTEVKSGRVTLPSATTGYATTTTAPLRVRAPTRLESPDEGKYMPLDLPSSEASSSSTSTATSTSSTAPVSSESGASVLPSVNKTHFFAVYDGHSGYGAAAWVKEDLPRRLALACQQEAVSVPLLRTTILASDEALCKTIRSAKMLTSYSAGTTVIVAVVEEASRKLLIANVGDSRAIVSANGKPVFVTVDHKPGLAEERELVKTLGGRVGYSDAHSQGKERFCCVPCWGCPCFLNYRRPLRVFPGGLAVSRTFGDVPKDTSVRRAVSAEPTITEMKLEQHHEFLIMGCDGVWDVVSNQRAVDLVKRQRLQGASAEDAANALCQLAYQRGSTDNISAVVVYFH